MSESHERFDHAGATPNEGLFARFKHFRESQFLESEHHARYKFATQFTNGKTVLDIAAGSGYGSFSLVQSGAKQVVGVELEPEAVEAARAKFVHPALEYRQDSGDELTRVPESFECIVSFETIEHIDQDRRFLELLATRLLPGGTIIISTPNRLISNPGKTLLDKPFNPFHVREYARDEFHALVSEYFQIREEYGQGRYRKDAPVLNRFIRFLKLASLATGLGQSWFAGLRPIAEESEPTYVILVCTSKS